MPDKPSPVPHAEVPDGRSQAALNFDNVLQVKLLDAKPNKMFTEWQTATTKFLRYNRAVPCAECGKRSKSHWTQLVSFQAMDMSGSSFVLRSASGKVHAPLTPVCGTHPLAVAEFPRGANALALAKARGEQTDAHGGKSEANSRG